ncbi:hypothetical protein [Rhodopirellula bahusiensis]|uniref:hypothetical protein n=2 Tax=Rhodopirellula bahusiensis TaxID=2014065 RepID=UPI0032664CA5
MTQLLAEQPLVISIMLGVLAAALIYSWLQTGKKALVISGLVCAALIPLAWVIAGNWVTDEERIETLIYDVAQAVEEERYDDVVELIGAEKTKAQAGTELQRYEFEVAKVGNIRSIKMVQGAVPPQANVDMTVKVTVSEKRGSIKNVSIPRRLMLTFEKSGDPKAAHGGWVVAEYAHLPIVGKADAYSTGTF